MTSIKIILATIVFLFLRKHLPPQTLALPIDWQSRQLLARS